MDKRTIKYLIFSLATFATIGVFAHYLIHNQETAIGGNGDELGRPTSLYVVGAILVAFVSTYVWLLIYGQRRKLIEATLVLLILFLLVRAYGDWNARECFRATSVRTEIWGKNWFFKY